jgi:urease accessory protein
MRLEDPVASAGWRAELALGFERRGARTVLATRRHEGPLVVQKPLYPEGDEICHAIVVHPPGGIAGGDELLLDVAVDAGAHVLLTTPGAAKWYRSGGPWALQTLAFRVAPDAVLEWLPQESIVFDAARARLASELHLSGDARFIGWELVCFGRSGSGERFEHGSCRLSNAIRRDGRLIWLERGRFDGGARLLAAAAGLRGQPISGTLVAVAPHIDDALLAECRRVAPARGEGAVTRLPEVLVARYLGDSSEAGRRYFVALWDVLRPALLGQEAREPRIWRT